MALCWKLSSAYFPGYQGSIRHPGGCVVALPFKCLFLLAFCQVFLKLDLGLPHSPLPLPSSHVFSVAVVDPVQLWKENCRGGELTHVWGPPNMKGRENLQAPNSSGRWASEDCGKAGEVSVCKGP